MTIIYTIGHWNRTISEFVGLLNEYGVEIIVDVRSSATSKSSPQFYEFQPADKVTGKLLYPDIPAMPDWLQMNGIRYEHILEIGGHRSVKHINHDNDGWENRQFRSYADYCKTDTWKQGFSDLMELGKRYQIAMMCGEPHPARCHRSILSDYLTAHGIQVLHIIKEKEDKPSRLLKHSYGAWGATPCVNGHEVTYPAQTAPNGLAL
jgi:uncharacterized protein (DUF488 family)